MEAKIIQKHKINYLVAHFKKIILLVMVIIFAAGYFFLINPKYQEIKTKIGDIGTKEEEQSSLQDKLIQITKLRSAYKSISLDGLERINMALPDSPSKDELLPQLETLISQNGLLLTSLQVDDLQKSDDKTDQKATGIGKIKISMNIVGTDYYNFKNILSVLEKNLRLLDVVSLKFSPTEESASLEVITYYMK